jgi:hypothetical protein
LRGPVSDLSDEELTDHEDLDDDHEEGVVGGEGWINVFESTDTGISAQGDTASTLVSPILLPSARGLLIRLEGHYDGRDQ